MNSLNTNKHVFCEKPIAENIEDTKKCYEAARAKVDYLRMRSNPNFESYICPSISALRAEVIPSSSQETSSYSLFDPEPGHYKQINWQTLKFTKFEKLKNNR